MADPKNPPPPQDGTSPGVASPGGGFEQGAEAAEDLNSTMMAIDVSKLNLDATKTGTKIPAPGEAHVFKSENVPVASGFKARLARLLEKLRSPDDRTSRRQLPVRLKPFQDIWFCDPNAGLLRQVWFYAFRLFLIFASARCQILLLDELERSFSAMHPARSLFLTAFAAQALLILAGLAFKFSPGWVLSLPLSVLAVVMAYGALFYHTADPLYFVIDGKPVSEILNGFYVFTLAYAAVAAATVVARKWLSRSAFILLHVLCLLPVIVNAVQGAKLEYAFFGIGFLRLVPAFYLQPLYLSFHVVMPAAFLALLVFAAKRTDTPGKAASAGMARSLALLFACLIALNFALMQKNRVFHALNLVFPKTLHVGGIEVKILNQNLKIETRNFAENEGVDQTARYRFRIEKAKEKNRFNLKLQDAFDFPVKFVTEDDLRVWSDDKEIKKYALTEEDESDTESGKYTLSLVLEPKQPPVEWAAIRQSLKPTDNFEFKLKEPAKVKRFVVRREEDVLVEVVAPKSDTVALPLTYFQTGAHKISVTLYDDLDQEIFRDELTLSIKLESDLALLWPLADDVVSGQLGALVKLKGPSRESVRATAYYVNGKLLHEAQGMSDFHSMDVSSFPDGELKLAVKVKFADKELTQEVRVFKRADAPQLVILRPAMGIFAERETPVAFRLSDENLKTSDVKVWVNGQPFADAGMRDNAFDLPVTRWEESEIYLAVQASLPSGDKVSDWVQLNRGLSTLDLKFDIKSLNFLNVNKMAVVLDASVSSLDNWQGKSKWYSMTNLILAPEVELRLKNFNPAFVVFGSGKPYYFEDCEDGAVVAKGESYNKASVKRKLEDITPRGVSAVIEALGLAYREKPDKIFLFADSSDSCRPGLTAALKPVFAKSPQTVINVFSLGRVRESDRKQLRNLAEKTGGRYFQPADYEALLKAWLEELSLNYELLSKEKSIYQSPLEDREFKLGPGAYTLKIPYGNQVKEVQLLLEHGTKTTLTVTGKTEGNEKRIGVDQVVTQL